jgi:hypothetical protein
MKIRFFLKILTVISVTLFFPAMSCLAAPALKTTVAPAVSKELEALLALIDSGGEAGFESSRIPALMNFVYASKPANTLYSAGNSFNANSAYGEFDINSGFDEFLKIAFNPDVPSYLLMPASKRLSHRKSVDGKKQPFPKLWQALPDLTDSVAVRGVEFIENTPDLFSGAYFAYDLDKLLILMKHEGRFVLLSISKQASISEVGKKGVILGPDENWTYLYSGQNGINRPGLGWVSSYMYDSYSVAVYAQLEKDRPGVRCGTFKWINAGWSKINMVKKEHIHSGLLRYAKTFKEIIENPVLPETDRIAEIYSQVRSYSLSRLQNKFYGYLNTLEARHRGDDSFPQKWFQEWFKSNRYLSRLKKEEMESLLMVEFIKHSLGRRSQIKMGNILGSVHPDPVLADTRLAYNK